MSAAAAAPCRDRHHSPGKIQQMIDANFQRIDATGWEDAATVYIGIISVDSRNKRFPKNSLKSRFEELTKYSSCTHFLNSSLI